MLSTYKLPLLLSLAVHALIVMVLSFKPSHPVTPVQLSVSAKPKVIIQAKVVTSESVMQEVNRLKQKRKVQRLSEQRRQSSMAKKMRTEERRLSAIRAEQKALKRNQRLAKKRAAKQLADVKRQKALATKQLQAAKRKVNSEKKRLQSIKQAVAKKKILVEKQRLAKIAEARKEADEKKRVADLKRKKLARMAALKLAAEKQAKLQGEIDKYKNLIIASISANWIVPPSVDKSKSSRFEIHLSPQGAVLSVKLLRSSGSAILDRSAQTAIYKASPLPIPSKAELYAIFKVVSLTVRPEATPNNS